jgi:CheY-like chemotaxis protein
MLYGYAVSRDAQSGPQLAGCKPKRLLDIGLPIVNGYEVAKWFREQPALQEVVLVAVTGYGQESDRRRSREAGFDHHLVKPMDFAKLESILSAVEKLLRLVDSRFLTPP